MVQGCLKTIVHPYERCIEAYRKIDTLYARMAFNAEKTVTLLKPRCRARAHFNNSPFGAKIIGGDKIVK